MSSDIMMGGSGAYMRHLEEVGAPYDEIYGDILFITGWTSTLFLARKHGGRPESSIKYSTR